MSNLINKNKGKIIISLVTIIGLFFSLSFFNGKGNKSLTERQRRLMQYDQVQPGDETIVGTEYITFDAFFLEDLDNDGNAEGLRGQSIEIGKTEKLYLELKVLGDVKLTNGKIRFENSNSRVAGTIKKGSLVSTNQESSNFSTITLKDDISNGLTVTKPLNVYANLTNDIRSYTGVNKVILTGTVTDLSGNKIADIEKEISYTVDWYGDKLNATVNGSGKFDKIHAYSNPVVNYNITASETAGQLFLKSFNMEGTVSQLNGRDPVSVTIYGSGITYDYDETTRKFTIYRNAVLDDTLITTQAYAYKNDLVKYNDVSIRVEYPYEESDEEGFTSVSVSTWYEAFNNNGGDLTDIKTSNKASRVISASFVNERPGGPDPIDRRSTLSVGKHSTVLDRYYIDKTEATSIYNGAEIENSKEDYRVSWSIYVPSTLNDENKGGNTYSLKLTDLDGDKLNNTVSMKDYVTYKSISFSNLTSALNSTGTITLINADTDETIHVFTALDWNDTYTFEEEVRSIRLEVNGFNYVKYGYNYQNYRNQLYFAVNAVKTINNNKIVENIPYETFDLYGSITSQYDMRIYNGAQLVPYDGREVNTFAGSASYINAQSQAYLTVNKSQIYTTDESEVIFTITTNEIDDISRGYKDGEYFILLPEDILGATIVDVTPDSNKISVVGASVGTLTNGRKYIKVLTSNTDVVKYSLAVKAKLLPDPRKTDKGITYYLYSYNPNCHNYRTQVSDTYDINGNNDYNEKVSYAYATMSISAPNEMITTSMLTNYDSAGSTMVAPLVAEVNPVEDDSEATVEIGLTNNSEFSAKNIRVIGKVAYDDNTYQIGEGSLGSEYDVQMTDAGITIPEELVGKATVYYSEEETPTTDLSVAANGWKLKDATDFSKVKSYMIVIDDYVMPVKKSLTFTYDVDMPIVTDNLNKVTYFTHGVYYDLVTDAGLHASSVGGSKLGIRMSRQYNLNLTNLKPYSDRPIAGSKYIITDEDGVQTIISTDTNGNAIAKDLYVDKEYTLKQISTPVPYVTDEEEKTFKVVNGDNDVLSVESTGTLKSIALNNTKELVVVHESETRYTVVLKNTDLDTDEAIEGAAFKLTGKGYEDGAILTTNANGEYTLKNLYVNERYTMTQIRNTGYLKLKEDFVIDVIRDETTGEVQITLAKKPAVTEPTTRLYSGYCTFRKSSSSSDGTYYDIESGCNSYSGKWIYGFINVDLTEFKEQYKLSYDVYWDDYYHNSYMYTWILDDKSQYVGSGNPSTSLRMSPSIIINYANGDYNGSVVNNNYMTDQVTKNENNSWVHQDFMGGQTYDVVFFYYKGYGYDRFKLKNITIEPISGLTEQVAQTEKTNVALANNQNVLQSIQDSDNQDAPVLTVQIKSAKIPTYTLEITKTDAETGDPLAGAQYKVMGPGLPATGKYITTDEFGKASIELYKKYNYDNINDINYTEVDNLYTIQEVVAPIGYMIDSKTIEFRGQQMLNDCTYRSGSYTCDMTQENVTYLRYESDGQFKEYTFDAASNTIRTTLQDYPIVKITKKDAETGEVLPNTLFAVYAVQTIGGANIETPATDPNGNVLGNEIEIDGKTYFVVKTDQNGNLNLNLPSGQYKLKEVQAADDKYEVDTAVYYFGVGETVPYQEAGLNLVGTTFRKAYDFKNSTSSYPIINFIGLDGGNRSSDGGYIGRDGENLVKYDADGNVEWSTPAKVEFYPYVYYLTWYDKPGVEEKRYCSYENYVGPESCSKGTYSVGESGYTKVIEVEDGYYVALGTSTEFSWIIKLDKDGNTVWQNSEYQYGYRYFYYGLSDGDYSQSNPHSPYYIDENTSYYTSYSLSYDVDYFNGKIADIAVDKDGNLYVIAGYIYNYSYHYNNDLYEHGEVVGKIEFDSHEYAYRWPDGTYYFPSKEYAGGNSYANLLFKYNKDGELYDIVDYNEKLYEGIQKYLTDHNLTGTVDNDKSVSIYPQYSVVKTYDDGSILFKMYYGGLTYNGKSTNQTSFYIKMDKDDNVIYLAPVAMNGSSDEMYNNYQGTEYVVIDNETGGFTLSIPYFDTGTTRDYIRYQNGLYDRFSAFEQIELYGVNQVELPTYHEIGEEVALPKYGSYIMKYDGNGNVIDATLYMSYCGSDVAELLYGDNYYGTIHSTRTALIYEMDDGYIIATDLYLNTNEKVRLKSGEIRKLQNNENDETFLSIIYKIDKQGNIEWLKELKGTSVFYSGRYRRGLGFTYDGYYSSVYYPEITVNDEGRLVMPYRMLPHTTVTETSTGVTIENDSDDSQWAYLEFELSKEVTPSGPEAYTLNIENKRKEYKVTATSNVGGKTVVTDPTTGDEIKRTDGAGTETLETVKYGDDNIYDITISTNPGYVIKSVTVNNEEIGYKVNDDLSITLDKIEDIKENKNIKITYDYGLSSVVVKHYLKDTTESVFSDQIITGQISTSYSVDPQSSYLYSVAKDDSGEVILPDNMEGTFTIDPITVIFYYTENEVELQTNYYIDGTDTELAPSNIERKTIGSPYQTSPLTIANYEVTRTLGETSGTLNRNTEVTYMYQQITDSRITIRYVDKATNQDIIDPIVKRVPLHDPYTTDDPVTLPTNYRFTNIVSGEPSGTADDNEIEVIYYYEVIPFNVKADKKINSVLLNGEKQTINDSKNVVISPFKKDNLIVYYEINVENTGEIKATFKIVEEDIPGFEIYDKGEFTKTDAGYELNVELEPGAKASYKIGYKWNQKDYGISTNKVELKEVTNPNGFDEPDSDDNISKATVETTIPEDVLDEDVIIPNTIDKIRTSIALFITSLCGVIVTIILMRKKRMN